MPSYEEQQKALRAQVPKGTAAATELGSQGFTDVGTVDVSQPSPKPTDLTKVATQGVGADNKPIYDVFAGQEHIADPNDPRLKGIDIAGLPEGKAPTGFQSKFGIAPSNYEKGFNQAKNAGITSPAGSTALSIVDQYAPSTRNDTASAFVQSDPILNSLVKSFQDYTNPNTQRESLVSAYKSMSKELGLEPLNEKMLNLEKIMRGTDDAIREQIQIAGGMANENQIRGLVNQRNKSFLEEYTTLQQILASKEKYLGTLIGLEQSDRQAASERFNQSFNMASKLADYQQRGQQFAQSSYQWIAEKTGMDGLYNSTNGDPYAINLIERTLGLPSGGLANSANQARLARTQAQTKSDLELQKLQGDIAMSPLERQMKTEQIKTEKAQQAKIYNEINNSGVGDPSQLIAYAQQYASTGMIPTGLPKGTFGVVANAAKALPKSLGQILDKATGVTPDKLGAAGDAYGALYSAIELSAQLKELDKNRWGGVIAGTTGKIFGSQSQAQYMDLRTQIVDLLARARSGAAINETELRTYSGMLPGRFSNTLGLGASADVRIDNFSKALTSDLINKTNSKGWVVNGLTPIKINGQDYKVGDMVQNDKGQTGRILPDGSVYLIQ